MTPKERAAHAINKAGPYIATWQSPEAIVDILATIIRDAVAEEREACARLLENFDAVNEDGEHITPGLGEWTFENGLGDGVYTPNHEAIARAIRKRGQP